VLIGCTRMYNVTPQVAGHWRALIGKVAAAAGVTMEVIDHPAPAPLDALWRRDDLGCAFMCGWPFQRREPKPQIVAAPVPVPTWCEGPTYRTLMVVRADSSYRTIEDTFGGRIAWTDEGSQSGFNAPRRLLTGYRQGPEPLYGESIGPVVTPRASINAVIEGRADVAPVDSYFHQLLARHEPETTAQVRVVARTDCTPIPLLIAARSVPPETVAKLGHTFAAVGTDPTFAPLLEDLCLTGFARIEDPQVYAITERWDDEARTAGYLRPS
jgi:ABC-type phosphate/phosphonate transport system substrate-binding protein